MSTTEKKKIKVKVTKQKNIIKTKNENNNDNNNNTSQVVPNEWILPNRKEFVDWINQTFIKYKSNGKTETIIPGKYKPFKYQKFLRDYMTNNSPYRGILLYQSTGSGKCVEKGTPIIMFDGTIKKVEDIQVGDLLMGDDSTPRTVTSLARGFDKMYEVLQSNSDRYVVNSEHILCLKAMTYPYMRKKTIYWIENNQFCSKKYIDKTNSEIKHIFESILNNNETNQNIIEISIQDYLQLSRKKKDLLTGYRVPIEFEEKPLELSAYMMGYKIGHEDSTIPYIYKCNSRKNRIDLLTGLLDSNFIKTGIKSKTEEKQRKSYIFKSNNQTLIDDLIYLIRSLGLKFKKLTSSKVSIYNNYLQNIPTKVLINKVKPNDEYNNELWSEITVNYVRDDDYYGFTLDGNCRFLFGDFTVTHNTCTAIEIAENLKTERNIVVMLPASLRNNFIINGLLFCGSPAYQNNPNLIKEKYTFISYNANNTIAQIKRIGSLDNKVIIIDEVHNLISKMMSGIEGRSKQGLEIYNYLMNAQNAKIIAMSGTPVVNEPFECAVLFNILKGYIELTYFRITKMSRIYGNEMAINNLKNQLLENNLIDYLEFNNINKSIEFHLKIKSYDENYRDLIDWIKEKCEHNGISVSFLENKNISLFPTEDDGELFRNYFIKENTERGDELKNSAVFKRRILGLVSYFKPLTENFPAVIHKDYYRIEMSNYQFQIYEILRAKERLSERGSSNKKSKKVKSTFRVFSRQASNFVFPEDILRPYPDPKFIVSILKKNENNKKINFNKILQLEDKANDGEIVEEYKKRIEQAIDKIVENGNIYLKPGPEGLDKLSPKMKFMLKNIKKSPGLVFVYSNFRTLEGVEIFSKILDFNGYSKYGSNNNLPKYAIYSGTEDDKQKKEIMEIFTSPKNKYGEFIKIILATSAGAEGLDLKNIRQIHILEPYWNQMRIEQVIGRGARRNSHIDLPPNERNVEVYRYFSVYSSANSMLTKDKLSTDEHIEKISLKKQNIINELLQILKECSIDCYLNNSGARSQYNCFSFGKNASGFSYHPNLSKDIIESYTVENVKKVKKLFKKGILDQNGNIYLYDPTKKVYHLYFDKTKTFKELNKSLKKKIILIDTENNEIFDSKNMNNLSYPIGMINKNSKFTKKK